MLIVRKAFNQKSSKAKSSDRLIHLTKI